MNLDLSIFLNCNLNTLHTVSSANTNIDIVLSEYKPLFENYIGKIEGMQARLRLKENVQPVFVKSRPVPFALHDRVKEELQNLINQGVLQPVSTSQWATAIVPVVKASGAIRVCGDYKPTLNPNLIIDDHPLPTINELFAKMSEGQKFSKIDIQQAYLHLEINPDDRELLTLNTSLGLLQPTRLMYGVSSAPAIWQKTMEQILQGIEGLAIFFDDITITAPNDASHIARLIQVFERFRKYNVKINFDKCKFLSNEIEYCGYRITKEGVQKTPSKIKEIENIPRPKNKHDLRVFLGLVNYYARFISNLSTIIHPLNNLIKDSVDWKWDSDCEKAFLWVKKEMNSDRVLMLYNPKLPLTLATDSSQYAVGAVLSHILPDGTEKPIQFASQTLSPTQRKYSNIDREAYAIIFGVRKFYQFLYGDHFQLITDQWLMVRN